LAHDWQVRTEFDPPYGVKRILQLHEDIAGAPDEENQAYHAGPLRQLRLIGIGKNCIYDLCPLSAHIAVDLCHQLRLRLLCIVKETNHGENAYDERSHSSRTM